MRTRRPPARGPRSGFDVDSGRRAADVLLDLSPRPTAVFAVNDHTALGVMGAMRDRGLVPGRDIAVVGFNDIDAARELTIPLSSVDSSPRRMGGTAAELLLARLNGREVRSVELEPALRIRASSLTSPGA
ncbi:substrate-binding domain-containing protein [Streptomyces sp. NPDC127068]|uniref:substrate-binding domain-containing protein n=1 Tax=Streptomyces sp. NPDC127068 TaxID=3347127 RepID=UPI00365E2FD1